MVPVYSISSSISLGSEKCGYIFEGIRDLYEAFVIYTFFNLCINYLGGERNLLLLMEGKAAIHYVWPLNYFLSPMNISNPKTLLSLRRGILQFVLMKPILTILEFILKFTGNYHEGYISWTSSYLYITIAYNITVTWSLYCLIMFYFACQSNLEIYKPLPKFLCVKAIVFFAFWQSCIISVLVWLDVIRDGKDYSKNNISHDLQNFLISLEMIPAAIAHWYSFTYKDYTYFPLASRVPLFYSIKDAFGFKDIVQDSYHTFKGTTFKFMEKLTLDQKYENQFSNHETDFILRENRGYHSISTNNNSHKNKINSTDGYSTSVTFSDINSDDEIEKIYKKSREFENGDYNYPVITSSKVKQQIADKQKDLMENKKKQSQTLKEKEKIINNDDEEIKEISDNHSYFSENSNEISSTSKNLEKQHLLSPFQNNTSVLRYYYDAYEGKMTSIPSI